MKILLTNESAGERLLKYFHQMVRINGSKSIGKLNFGRLVYDQQVVDQSFGSKTLEVLSCIAQLIALCLFTVATSPKLFVGMAILFAIFCYLLFDYRRRFQKLAFERSEYNNQLLTRFSEWQKGRRLLTCLKQASSWRQQFLIPVIYGSDQSAIRAAALERWISIQAESIGIAMVIGISLIGMKTSTFVGASGLFAICLSYCQQMITSLGRFMRFTVDWDQDLVSFNRLIETSREVYDNDATLRAENSEEAQHGDLEVKELTFRHEGRDRLIFSDASLNVRSGDRVAIIGPTGSGKSTLLQIFRGILPVTRGHLRLGSIWTDLTHEMPNSTNICIVEQAATVYPGPIKELFSGISYGEAKKTCGDLGLKLTQTAFEETPEFLSAIERQQVMLASAVHHQGKVIILDEPTAALADQQAFETIAIFLSKVSQKTVLMITHQPQLLQLCHETYHLENGTFRASSVRNEYAST